MPGPQQITGVVRCSWFFTEWNGHLHLGLPDSQLHQPELWSITKKNQGAMTGPLTETNEAEVQGIQGLLGALSRNTECLLLSALVWQLELSAKKDTLANYVCSFLECRDLVTERLS